MTGTGVAALVLTFNAPEELTRCVRAIDAQVPQPDRLVVVDNDSLQPAADVIEPLGLSVPVDVLRLDENTGPAGGHAAGLAWFAHSDHERAWVMDDDCEARPGALAALLAAAHEAADDVDPVYPTWINTALGRATDYPAWCGFLVRRSTVEALGGPRPEFFWWMEDTEYLHWRLPEAGFRSVRIAEAEVLHHQDRRRGPKPGWKYYYEVRNATYFRLRIQRGRGRRFYRLGRAVGASVKGAVRGPDPVRSLGLVGRGLVDGLRGSLGIRRDLPPLATHRS